MFETLHHEDARRIESWLLRAAGLRCRGAGSAPITFAATNLLTAICLAIARLISAPATRPKIAAASPAGKVPSRDDRRPVPTSATDCSRLRRRHMRVDKAGGANCGERVPGLAYRGCRGVFYVSVELDSHARRLSTNHVHAVPAARQAVCNSAHVTFDAGEAVAAHDLDDVAIAPMTGLR